MVDSCIELARRNKPLARKLRIKKSMACDNYTIDEKKNDC
jgi:hypothetical protein